jgi:antagonist of KipI
MDPFHHRLANGLVGNHREAATLEVTIGGPELEFDDERLVAVAGAVFDLRLDNTEISSGRAFVVPAGARLRFGERRCGARAYVAVEGGIDVPRILGSRATHTPSGIGGWRGRMLVAGDRLPLGPPFPRRPRRFPLAPTPAFSSPLVVRALLGPQQDRFTTEAQDVLQSAPYIVASDSDRMGYRLIGPLLTHAGRADTISEPTAIGTVQVPASGRPILLMADRQTAGGYPKLATVITADLGMAGQAAPGDALSFVLCTMADARAALLDSERTLMAYEAAR